VVPSNHSLFKICTDPVISGYKVANSFNPLYIVLNYVSSKVSPEVLRFNKFKVSVAEETLAKFLTFIVASSKDFPRLFTSISAV